MRNIHRIKSQRRRRANRLRRMQSRIPYAQAAVAGAPRDGDSATADASYPEAIRDPLTGLRLARAVRVGRVLIGVFLILHGLAHARAGSVLADPARSWRLFNGTVLGAIMVWTTQALWAVSMLGFIAGGLGLLGVAGVRRHAQRLIIVAAVASGLLLVLAERPYALGGAVIDIGLLVLTAASAIGKRHGRWIWHRTLLEELSSAPRTGVRERHIARTFGNVAGWVFLAYVAILGAIRPWHRTWGTTEAELGLRLPGDEIAPHVAAMHAVTINAPASAVWPWLVQMGQGRGGFYSYTGIENNLLGAGIHNADRIHPEWQDLREGDFVRSARPDWLGGRFRDRTGWLVVDVETGRSITLLGWGTFAVLPIDATTSRFLIRTRAGDGAFLWAPFDFLILEPGHFLMERRMMLGIKERAEAAFASTFIHGG